MHILQYTWPPFVNQKLREARLRIQKPDVNATVAYGPDKMMAGLVPGALALMMIGMAALAFSDLYEKKIYWAAATLIAASALLMGYVLYRRFHPSEPLYTLSPTGVKLLIPRVKTVDIPWRDVHSVGMRNIHTWVYSRGMLRTVSDNDVTTIRVTQEFYDRNIHHDRMRSPGWNNWFDKDEDGVGVALNHLLVAVPAEGMHEAVISRWRQFGGTARSAAAEPISFAARRKWRLSTYLPSIPAPLARMWGIARYAVPIGGILLSMSNLAGLWSFKYQIRDRAAQAVWQARLEKLEAEDKQRAKEQAETDSRLEQLLKDSGLDKKD